MSATVAVPREVLQAVFDAATESLDFGSGFLDDVEVEALRQVAVLLGVDPMVATPPNYACKYATGKHVRTSGRCMNCGDEDPT